VRVKVQIVPYFNSMMRRGSYILIILIWIAVLRSFTGCFKLIGG
jgi:hypothetical protein